MHIRRAIENSWAFIVEHWTTALALTSLFLVLLATIISPLEKYLYHFLFACLNAVVWLLVDIRYKLQKNSKEFDETRTQYSSMRAAKPKIIEEMIREFSSKKNGRVTISGGRIRAITELIREFSASIESDSSTPRHGLIIDLYLIDPNFIEQLVMPGEFSKASQQKRNKNTANMVRSSIVEIEEMNNSDNFTSNKVEIRPHLFKQLPFAFFYIFGTKSLVYGGYRWDSKTSDLVGPTNPCWFINQKHQEFKAIRDWLSSRANMVSHANK